MKPPLLALTVWNPWAWAIAAGYKTIENRTWAPPDSYIGRALAIHAGKGLADAEGAAAFQRMLVATSKLEDLPSPLTLGHMASGAIVGVGILKGWTKTSSSPWFVGPIGLVWADVVPIRPVACKGAQKIWGVPQSIADEVRLRYKETLLLRKGKLELCKLCRAATRENYDPLVDDGLCPICQDRPHEAKRVLERAAVAKDKERQARREGRAR